ncbi:hypothetical protein Fmac_008269 [Flemingia macrophylla]|uniref:G-patch domain-containing protein n=1 Tax=Flemingia macrophylla TaxID=520843 RepID=A0ABD1MX00_9FABA
METTPKDDVGEETVKTTSLGAAHQLLGQQGCSGDDKKEAFGIPSLVLFNLWITKTMKVSHVLINVPSTPDKYSAAPSPKNIVSPSPFPQESNKVVPWEYDIQTSVNEDISNIARIGSMMRNGRIYTPNNLQDKASKEKEKIEEKEKEFKEETDELLKFMRQRNVRGIVSHITATDHLTFTDEEIPPEGAKHNKPLHISVKCKEYLIAKVLVDNGSSLNVMPKREINHPIQIGPTIFNVEFQVMDITLAYSCLLGRPWIHDAKAVPSTLHQKVKFIVGDKLVMVQAEDDIIINKPSALPYVDAAEEAIETSLQALEIANVEKFPRDMKTVAQMLIRTGYLPGQGFGKDSQGIIELPIIKDNPRKYPNIKASYSHQMPFTFSRDMIDLMTVEIIPQGEPDPQALFGHIFPLML